MYPIHDPPEDADGEQKHTPERVAQYVQNAFGSIGVWGYTGDTLSHHLHPMARVVLPCDRNHRLRIKPGDERGEAVVPG